jgi:hypothetical protein
MGSHLIQLVKAFAGAQFPVEPFENYTRGLRESQRILISGDGESASEKSRWHGLRKLLG